MWSCSPVQTPPSCPVIQSFGNSLGQFGSTAKVGAGWALAGAKAIMDASAVAVSVNRNIRIMLLLLVPLPLLKLLAAQVDCLDAPHIRNVLEWIPRQHQQVR